MRPTSKSVELIFLATYLLLESLSISCDAASSPRKPHFALFGVLLAIAALLISIGELIYRGKRERVVLRRWGKLWWFYHPPPPQHTPFGTHDDISGLLAGISQCICSIVQYVYCLQHADSPWRVSLVPAIYLICSVGSRLTKKRMNTNTTDDMDLWEYASSTKETSLHLQEYHAPAKMPFLDNQEIEEQQEQQEQEQWQQAQEQLQKEEEQWQNEEEGQEEEQWLKEQEQWQKEQEQWPEGQEQWPEEQEVEKYSEEW